MCLFICQASLTLSRADKHELKILPLDGFQQLRVGKWGNGPVRGFALCTNNKEGSNRF